MNRKSILQPRAFRFILLVFFIGLFCFFGRLITIDIDTLRAVFQRFPVVLSGILFIFAYVVITFFVWFGPKDVFRTLGAVFFGAYVSAVLVYIAEMINVFVLFKFSRKLGRGFVAQKFHIPPEKLDKIKKDSNIFNLFTLRINLLIPFRLMDVAAGLSPVRFGKYFFAALAGTPIRVFWLQYILAGMGEGVLKGPEAFRQFLEHDPFILTYTMIYIPVIILLSLTAGIRKAWQTFKASTPRF